MNNFCYFIRSSRLMIHIESHIADMRIRLKAESIEDLFSEGMKSLYIVMESRGRKGKIQIAHSLELSGSDKTVLLIDFMNEVLSYSLIHKCVFDNILLFKTQEDGLLIDLQGYKVKSFSKDVKAVTFHEAEITESEAGVFETMVILDI